MHALAGEALPTMSGERLNVFATRMTLTMMKGRVKGAQQGHKLLKRKADALTMKFRAMAKVIKDVRAAPLLLGGGEPSGRRSRACGRTEQLF